MSKRELTLRYLVDVRAAGRCEYCRRYKRLIGETFLEVEHILPRSRGGLTTPSNLAFACRRCNLLKSDVIEALDLRTEQLVALFHPRFDQWPDHFRRSRDQLRIYGRTASGRATVALLQFNAPSEQEVRRIQRDYLFAVFPLD